MYLPASYQAPKDMPFGCPSELNAVQRAACMSGRCRGRNCLYIGDARIVRSPRMPQIMQTVTPAVQIASATPVATMPAATPATVVPVPTATPASSAASVASAAAAPANGTSSLLQNALSWVQANPLLAGGLVLGALLLMHGGKR